MSHFGLKSARNESKKMYFEIRSLSQKQQNFMLSSNPLKKVQVRLRWKCESKGTVTCGSEVFFILLSRFVPLWLKGTQAWDNLNFLLPKSNPYMPFVNSRKTFASFPSIFARILMFEYFRGDWAFAKPHFFYELSKNFFPKIFTLVLLDGFLDGFLKFRLFIVKICILIWYFWVFFENYSMCMLSIRGNDFITCWAYKERVSAHAQPAVWCEQFLHVQSILSIRVMNFIAHWAYAERISSHAEHMRNRFHRMLSMHGNV